MSYGALTTKDGKYFSIESQKNADTEDFGEQIWVNRTPLLTDVLGITDKGYMEINRIIGRFVEAIQKISFVRQDTLDAFRHEMHGSLFDGPDHNLPILEASTLHVGTLVATFRQQITDVIKDILKNIPHTSDILGDVLNKEPVSGKNPPEIRNEAMSVGSSVADNGELAYMDFLTPEAREMLDKLGQDYARLVNEKLALLAQTVLTRAELSFTFFLGDAGRIIGGKRDNGKNIDRDAKYSTLDPFNLIQSAWQILHNLPSRILLELPEETSKPVFNRLSELSKKK